jgi:hypothetical protein
MDDNEWFFKLVPGGMIAYVAVVVAIWIAFISVVTYALFRVL